MRAESVHHGREVTRLPEGRKMDRAQNARRPHIVKRADKQTLQDSVGRRTQDRLLVTHGGGAAGGSVPHSLCCAGQR